MPATAATPRSSKSPPGVRPCSSRPPARRRALGQADQPGAGARDRDRRGRRPAAGCGPRRSARRRRRRRASRRPLAPCACLRALVSALLHDPVGVAADAVGHRRRGRPRRHSELTRMPGLARLVEQAREVGERRLRALRARRRRSSRSTPITSRRSSQRLVGARADRRRRARAISSGGASGRNSSAPACMLSSEIRWASTSCISRAIRARSCGCGLLDAQLLLGLGALGALAQRQHELAPRARTYMPHAIVPAVMITMNATTRHTGSLLLGVQERRRSAPRRSPTAVDRRDDREAPVHGDREQRERRRAADENAENAPISASTTATCDRPAAAPPQQAARRSARRRGRAKTSASGRSSRLSTPASTSAPTSQRETGRTALSTIQSRARRARWRVRLRRDEHLGQHRAQA